MIYVLLALAVIVVVLGGAYVTFFVHRGGMPVAAGTSRTPDEPA